MMSIGINIRNDLLPKNLIQSIPCFKSQNMSFGSINESFLKDQLIRAEDYHNIIRLARGEGRELILEKIIDSPNIIFDWGEKSMHSFLTSSDMREFLEPGAVSKDKLLELLSLYEEELKRHYSCSFSRRNLENSCKEFIEKVKKAINEVDKYDELIIIKEWLCYALHTSGNYNFRHITPWVSTSMGIGRYQVCWRYGRGKLNKQMATNNKKKNHNNFIILDYWVPVHEEGQTFRNTNYVIEKLRKMGIPWYSNRSCEVMVKYALFPHQIVGYYYFENDELKYYFINHHYLEKWKKDSDFKIGEYVYIDQENVKFPDENPYRIIYLKKDKGLEVYSKR